MLIVVCYGSITVSVKDYRNRVILGWRASLVLVLLSVLAFRGAERRDGADSASNSSNSFTGHILRFVRLCERSRSCLTDDDQQYSDKGQQGDVERAAQSHAGDDEGDDEDEEADDHQSSHCLGPSWSQTQTNIQISQRYTWQREKLQQFFTFVIYFIFGNTVLRLSCHVYPDERRSEVNIFSLLNSSSSFIIFFLITGETHR